MEVYNQIKNKIDEANKVLIISHINPDGDTLGSMCALKLFIGDKADMLVQTRPDADIPEFYKFLPKISEAKTLRNVQDIYDLVITVDVASIDRMVLMGRKIFQNAKNTINIDHHQTNPNYAQINLVEAKASSCGEILFNFFVGIGAKITPEMAESLYVSIMTDTGAFRYDNTSSETLEIASKLTRLGANCAEISDKVYDTKPKEMVMLQAYVLSNTQFIENNKIAYTKITNKLMKDFNAKYEHTEGIAEAIRSIKEVEISVVLKENDNATTKASMRSKNFDLTKITERFQGGGHAKSAGCTINLPIDAASDKLINAIREEFNK